MDDFVLPIRHVRKHQSLTLQTTFANTNIYKNSLFSQEVGILFSIPSSLLLKVQKIQLLSLFLFMTNVPDYMSWWMIVIQTCHQQTILILAVLYCMIPISLIVVHPLMISCSSVRHSPVLPYITIGLSCFWPAGVCILVVLYRACVHFLVMTLYPGTFCSFIAVLIFLLIALVNNYGVIFILIHMPFS